jgi:glutathione-regulated potassium-efflux system ancillary protein KefG
MRILVLAAHPNPSESIVQRAMLKAIRSLEGITIRDLYADYPNFDINIEREQQHLLAHDLIVLQHPVYWYSSPAILKEWQDLVLEHGWAYGPGGDRLHGKFMLQAVSTGGPPDFYSAHGRNRFELRDLLSPFNQTAHLCGMAWLEPFILYAGRKRSETEIFAEAERYRDLITALRDDRANPLKLLAQGFTLPRGFKAARKQALEGNT